jgi:trk system potassium uptake protein
MKRFIVIGLGNFGSGVAETLHRSGHDVIAIDLDEQAVDRIAAWVGTAAVGDGKDARTLERVGARDADAAVVSTGDDITASVLTTLSLRDIGVREIYVKVISRDHARVMEKLGVTETVFPERESAIRLGRKIANTALLQYLELGTDFSIQEMAVPDAWVGRSLRELELPRRFGVSVVTLHDVLTDEMISAPDPDAPLKESDTLIVAGRNDQLARVATSR